MEEEPRSDCQAMLKNRGNGPVVVFIKFDESKYQVFNLKVICPELGIYWCSSF